MASLGSVLRLARTVRHLKPGQIWHRAAFRLLRPTPDLAPPPALRAQASAWQRPAERSPSLVGPSRLRFLNVERDLVTAADWDDPRVDKLWRYNLHYFEDLTASDHAERRDWHLALLDRWLEDNPPGNGSGWEPYPLSLRIVCWIKWALAGGPLSADHLHSLAIQARWLMGRLEYHLLGNHLFVNAKALVFAGLWFEGPEAEGWLNKGLDILDRQVPEQILADGGQFELSPMYHALALEDILDLVNIARACAGARVPRLDAAARHWTDLVAPMQRWLKLMCHPDGEIALFNDAAIGIAPAPAELERYARDLGFAPPVAQGGAIFLPDSGYARLATDSAVVIADLARIGPDYLPGHAHADSLSFEMSLFGQRLIVNSGTSEYGTGPERLRQRGTAAHSTVTVAGQDSSEVWSGFRVGRRARPLDAAVSDAGNMLSARAAHDGYRHLARNTRHMREWQLDTGQLIVRDRVVPGLDAEARYHLHPDVAIEQTGTLCGRMTLSDGRTIGWRAHGAGARIDSASWHPQFGRSLPGKCLVITLDGGASTLELDWR
ncbi:MAG: heparinase II/III family protein [Blastomonas sp.]